MILKSRNAKVMVFGPKIHNNSAIILPGFPGLCINPGRAWWQDYGSSSGKVMVLGTQHRVRFRGHAQTHLSVRRASMGEARLLQRSRRAGGASELNVCAILSHVQSSG